MRFTKIWNLFEEIFSGFFFMVGITLIFVGVMLRYIMNEPSTWIDEFSVYFIIWGAVVGWSTAQRDGRHIRVDMLYDLLKIEHQRYFSIFSNLVGLGFSVFLAYSAYYLVVKYLQTGLASINVAFPLWIVYIFFPLAALLLVMRYLQEIVFILKNGGSDWFERQRKQRQAEVRAK